MRRTLFAVIAGLPLLMTGCGNNSAPSAPTPGSGTVTTASPVPVTPSVSASPDISGRESPGTPSSCVKETGQWDTNSETNGRYSTDPLYNVRIGRHGCYDRVTFDVNGSGPVGYDVRYVPELTEDGSGRPVPVTGNAVLQVIIHAPAQGSQADESGHQPGKVFAPSGTYLYGPGGLEDWDSVQSVSSAGSFEGQTTLGIGVRSQQPFAVSSYPDPNNNRITHITVDIAQ